jgi:hypothetical protein
MHVLLQHCVCRCYSRLITTRRLQWYYCHCSWRSGRLSFAMVGAFWVGDVVWCGKRSVCQTMCIYMVKRKLSFLLSTSLRGSGTDPTGVFNFPCLKEWNKTAFDVWFYVLMIIPSSITGFFGHQNKCRPALRVEVSCLCMGDSNLDHVPLHSQITPKLARIHQNTITLHSHPKRGVVVWSSGMWGIGILMHPEFLFCIMTGIIYISPT